VDPSPTNPVLPPVPVGSPPPQPPMSASKTAAGAERRAPRCATRTPFIFMDTGRPGRISGWWEPGRFAIKNSWLRVLKESTPGGRPQFEERAVCFAAGDGDLAQPRRAHGGQLPGENVFPLRVRLERVEHSGGRRFSHRRQRRRLIEARCRGDRVVFRRLESD